jgi:hypothetical protein
MHRRRLGQAAYCSEVGLGRCVNIPHQARFDSWGLSPHQPFTTQLSA